MHNDPRMNEQTEVCNKRFCEYSWLLLFIESFGLEATLKIVLLQPLCSLSQFIYHM